MCREQLVKLQPKLGEFTAEGAAVLGISVDTPEAAARLVKELNLGFPILSDPRMGENARMIVSAVRQAKT